MKLVETKKNSLQHIRTIGIANKSKSDKIYIENKNWKIINK